MKDHILAIDYGTQSVRALIFDLRGNMVCKARVPVEPYFSDKPGLAEQHPDYFWDNLCAACQQLWQESPVPKEALAGAALTTQRATMVNVDAAVSRCVQPSSGWTSAVPKDSGQLEGFGVWPFVWPV